ncbi:hypothetical protein IQ07DRAFT_675360 [Pyrenochaeta sp. DS3sAY3a]|nr:hypothetical protein IQ07DRAFT_675360 [Pyrenochaeta sp. DS3sAY3a]
MSSPGTPHSRASNSYISQYGTSNNREDARRPGPPGECDRPGSVVPDLQRVALAGSQAGVHDTPMHSQAFLNPEGHHGGPPVAYGTPHSSSDAMTSEATQLQGQRSLPGVSAARGPIHAQSHQRYATSQMPQNHFLSQSQAAPTPKGRERIDRLRARDLSLPDTADAAVSAQRLQFHSLSEARANIPSHDNTERPPAVDDTIPTTDKERETWVRRLVTAIKNRENVLDKRKNDLKRYNAAGTTEDRGDGYYYSAADIETKCWELVDAVERFHQDGLSCVRTYDREALKAIKKEISCTFKDRMENLILLLWFFKSKCDTVMGTTTLEDIVAQPSNKLALTLSNRFYNDSRTWKRDLLQVGEPGPSNSRDTAGINTQFNGRTKQDFAQNRVTRYAGSEQLIQEQDEIGPGYNPFLRQSIVREETRAGTFYPEQFSIEDSSAPEHWSTIYPVPNNPVQGRAIAPNVNNVHRLQSTDNLQFSRPPQDDFGLQNANSSGIANIPDVNDLSQYFDFDSFPDINLGQDNQPSSDQLSSTAFEQSVQTGTTAPSMSHADAGYPTNQTGYTMPNTNMDPKGKRKQDHPLFDDQDDSISNKAYVRQPKRGR